MKKIIRLTESDLHKIVKESVNEILREHEGWREEDFNPNYPSDDNEYEETWLDKSKAWREDHLSNDDE